MQIKRRNPLADAYMSCHGMRIMHTKNNLPWFVLDRSLACHGMSMKYYEDILPWLALMHGLSIVHNEARLSGLVLKY